MQNKIVSMKIERNSVGLSLWIKSKKFHDYFEPTGMYEGSAWNGNYRHWGNFGFPLGYHFGDQWRSDGLYMTRHNKRYVNLSFLLANKLDHGVNFELIGVFPRTDIQWFIRAFKTNAFSIYERYIKPINKEVTV